MKEPDHFSETLPEGAQLTLTELREMACQQQAQIEAQHQLLAAKEQRLRYLKEQELRQQRVHAESERLRRLRDRVDAQELKLRKLRALRGQVDQNKQNNLSLTSDLDSIRALFNEKEKELSLAVAKVEELTKQLEELRRGRNKNSPPPSALELDKLRRELLYRNKLNEQQNQRLHQQREALTARQEEMSAIDKRISELQERLHRKRLLNQQLASQISATSHKAAYHQLVRLATGNHHDQSNHLLAIKHQQSSDRNKVYSRGNIAAVEPYNHIPVPQNHQQIKSVNNIPEMYHHQPVFYTKKDQEIHDNMVPNQKLDNDNIIQDFSATKTDPKYQTLPYNTKFTVNSMNLVMNKNNLNNKEDKENMNNNTSDEIKDRDKDKEEEVELTHSGHMTVHSAPLYMVNRNVAKALNQQDLLLKNNNEDLLVIQKEKEQSTMSVNTNYQKPISSVAPTSVQHTNLLSTIYQTSSIKIQPVEPQTVINNKTTTIPTTTTASVNLPTVTTTNNNNNLITSAITQLTYTTIPSVLATHNSTPVSHNFVTTVQSSVSSSSLILSPPQSSSTPLNTTPEIVKSPKPALPPKPAIKPPPRQTQQTLNDESSSVILPLVTTDDKFDDKNSTKTNIQKTLVPTVLSSISKNDMIIKAKPLSIKKQHFFEQPKLRNQQRVRTTSTETSSLLSNFTSEKNTIINTNINEDRDETDKSSISVSDNESEEKAFDNKTHFESNNVVMRRCKKGNLKLATGKHQNLSRRVSFDPLALLLDASLEGELELVKKTATQVTNPSAANDEGITALHNAICAGHLEIVKFLVEFGCDVNAQDSDGWTPLHCAASCNNLTMVKFLVEHGACIFATTLSDHETAAEKCEEDEEGFDGCSEYLYSVQEKLGILSNGVVYAVFDYTAQQPDELSFKEGEQITVLRKGDENEREWWWSVLGDKEGYIPRNLLGLYPRVLKTNES